MRMCCFLLILLLRYSHKQNLSLNFSFTEERLSHRTQCSFSTNVVCVNSEICTVVGEPESHFLGPHYHSILSS